MNLDHLASRMKLDMRHLEWQSRAEHLSRQQTQQRFDTLAQGYCAQVEADDRKSVEAWVQSYQQQMNL